MPSKGSTDLKTCPCGAKPFQHRHTWWHEHHSKQHLNWQKTVKKSTVEVVDTLVHDPEDGRPLIETPSTGYSQQAVDGNRDLRDLLKKQREARRRLRQKD